MDLRKIYDAVMELQAELENPFDSEGHLDPKALKALVATYELQDYLTNRIATAAAVGELNPDQNGG